MSKSKVYTLCIALMMLGGVAWFDYITGYRVSVFVLYAIPVAWVSWSVGPVLGVLVALVSSVLFIDVNIWGGNPVYQGWIIADRLANSGLILLFISFSFIYFRKSVDRNKKRILQLEGILSICRHCERIKSGDGWVGLGIYIKDHTDADFQPRLCPECARVAYNATGPQVDLRSKP